MAQIRHVVAAARLRNEFLESQGGVRVFNGQKIFFDRGYPGIVVNTRTSLISSQYQIFQEGIRDWRSQYIAVMKTSGSRRIGTICQHDQSEVPLRNPQQKGRVNTALTIDPVKL